MMKKILDQLELNVQWLALGLGIVFAVYMSYAYLLDPPVKTEVAGVQVGPGEIDDKVWDSVGNQLSQVVVQPAVPKVEAPNLTGLFADAIKYNKKPLPADTLAIYLPANKDLPVDPQKGPDQNHQTPSPDKKFPSNPVAKLPELPALKLAGMRNGMSNVMPPLNSAANGQPVVAMDSTWVTVRGEIDIAAIQQAFNAVNIPANAQKTSFILLALDREEKMPDGSWGNHTTVPHIKTSDVQTIPALSAAPGDLWAYLQWAEGHTVDILQPPFYTVVKGDPWAVPGEQVAALNNTPQAAFNPSQWLDAKPADIEAAHLTMEQKQQISKAKQDRAKAASKGRSSSRGPTRGDDEGGPGPGAGAMHPAPNDPGRPQGGRPGGPPFNPRNPAGRPEMADDSGEMADMGGPAAQQPSANFPVPVGAFDPADWLKQHQGNGKLTVWAHDETAQPGHTYHYQLTYTIKSPIFFGVNVAKDPALTKIFAITSAPSGWTDEVEFISTVNFWVVRPPRSSGQVDVQVFRWLAGETKSKAFSVAPGDMIGQKEGDVDFTTGWTVVDVQYDPRSQDYYLLVMDPTGLIHHRDFKTDSTDPKLKSWRDQATVASTAGTPTRP